MAFFARDAFICTCKKEECDMCNKKYFEPNTNADRIRAMTDEELAEFFKIGCPPGYDLCGACVPAGDICNDCWLDWMKQECE